MLYLAILILRILPHVLDLEDKVGSVELSWLSSVLTVPLQIKGIQDHGDQGMVEIHKLIFQFNGRVNVGFERTKATLKMLEDQAHTHCLESKELEQRFYVLEEQLHHMDAKIEERESTITELKSTMDFLTNKRCRCNKDKVCCLH